MKEYKLKTLKQILEVVNEDNFVGFVLDFHEWLVIQVATKDSNVLKDKNFGTFHWIDDGKNDVRITVDIKSNDQTHV